MTSEAVEISSLVQRSADALNRADLEEFLALIHPEVEFTSMIAEAEGETFRGLEGVRRWWESIRGAFEHADWRYTDIRTHGDRGVAKVRIHGILSGVELEQTMWQAFIAREGRARWWAFFRTETEAREAAGLDDP